MKKSRCPYCKRKISYFTRFVQHNLGEHECKHCNKKSNIKQDSSIWILFSACTLYACGIMFLYLFLADSATKNGNTFLIKMFFGEYKIIKWFLWELVPFLIFYFVSPLFMTFTPQQRFIEQTTTSIDLNIPKVPLNNTAGKKEQIISGSTRVVSSQEIEEISGSFGNLEKTRAFDMNDITEDDSESITVRADGISVRRAAFESDKEDSQVNITKESTSVSDSYRDSTPLRKIPIEERNITILADEDDDVKPYVPEKMSPPPVIRTARETEKPKTPQGNYSANRKF